MALSDWDFKLTGSYRAISALRYVSAPSSLILGSGKSQPTQVALSRHPDAQNLPQGELRTWKYFTSVGSIPLCFRNQTALGGAEINNGYCLNVSGSTWTWYRVVNNNFATVATFAIAFPINVWEHWRFVWWNGENLSGAASCCLAIYKEVDSAWVLQTDVKYDTANQWATSNINRVGIGAPGNSGMFYWYDDTEIWKPTA
jgi:hypothetical protein